MLNRSALTVRGENDDQARLRIAKALLLPADEYERNGMPDWADDIRDAISRLRQRHPLLGKELTMVEERKGAQDGNEND